MSNVERRCGNCRYWKSSDGKCQNETWFAYSGIAVPIAFDYPEPRGMKASEGANCRAFEVKRYARAKQ
ncbi:MAG: hypothetical protein DSY80_01965 [Desulfocapsa sp.]|nr:MAG: hypothetical protein DSY80_01965 [Desulfocapsa sp.]